MKLSLKEYDAMQSGWRKWINEHMEIGGFKTWGMDFTGKDILEVGCGSGYSASLIVKDHPKSYTGMDIMPEQLEKAEALKLPYAKFVQGDAADLSRFEEKSFDMIVDFMILHHVEGWRRFLAKAHPDPPFGKQLIGYLLTALAAAGYAGLLFFLGADGLRHGYGFWNLFWAGYFEMTMVSLSDFIILDCWLPPKAKPYVKGAEHCKAWERREWLKTLAIPEHGLLWTLIVCPIAGLAVAGMNMLI